jgi:hypothetical protein
VPQLHQDSAPCATAALGLGSPPAHICTGTDRAHPPRASAPALRRARLRPLAHGAHLNSSGVVERHVQVPAHSNRVPAQMWPLPLQRCPRSVQRCSATRAAAARASLLRARDRALMQSGSDCRMCARTNMRLCARDGPRRYTAAALQRARDQWRMSESAFRPKRLGDERTCSRGSPAARSRRAGQAVRGCCTRALIMR